MIFSSSYLTLRNLLRGIQETDNKLNKKRSIFDHPVLSKVDNHLKIHNMFTNFICYNYSEFHKNFMNIYKKIKISLKNAKMFYTLFTSNWKCSHSNYTKPLEYMIKCIENTSLKFKINPINIQSGMNNFSKYFYLSMRQQ